MQREEVWFNTLIIGNEKKAKELFKTINSNVEKTGYRICGFISNNQDQFPNTNKIIPFLGNIASTKKIIDNYSINEVIIALPNEERDELEKILQTLAEKEVNVKLMPDKVDILAGNVRTTNVM